MGKESRIGQLITEQYPTLVQFIARMSRVLKTQIQQVNEMKSSNDHKVVYGEAIPIPEAASHIQFYEKEILYARLEMFKQRTA